MLNLPVLRWDKEYTSLETEEVVHFMTGEPIACVSQANGGLLKRDMRKAPRAREVLREIPPAELLAMVGKAGELYMNGTLPIGDGEQTPAEFCHAQSATTGLPEHMCRANMAKNHFVLSNIGDMLDALTRGLNLDILARGYGKEDRDVTVSYQAQAPALGLVMPSNSPGVHTLWLPVIPMQVGLVLKPGPQEPWTPFRMRSAFVAAGIPPEAIAIYPGGADVGAAVLENCTRAMIFGGQPTVDNYKGNPQVQAHGPGYSKIIFGDDEVDNWEQHLDLMVDSVYGNSGRGCINCSAIWASRHTKEIAEALAERLGPIEVKPPEDPEAALAAFTVPGQAQAVWGQIESEAGQSGATHMTESYGPRLVELERCAYLRPTVVHCTGPDVAIAKREYMYPFVTVVECPQEKMLREIGPTLVCTAITGDSAWQSELIDATHIDRLNLGAIPTIKLDWLQPHEGNIVEFLFRARALQVAESPVPVGA